MIVEIKSISKSISVEIPDEWNDLTFKQWKYSLLLLIYGEIYFNPWLNSFLKRKRFQWVFEYIDLAHFHEIADGCDLLKNNQMHYKSMMKRVGLFRGPDDCLKNVVWKQFGLVTECLSAYSDALKQDDNGQIRKYALIIFFTLYQPFFTSFKSERIEFYCKMFRWMLSDKTLKLAVNNVIGMLQHIEAIYPNAHDSAVESNDSIDLGFRGLSVQLAGGKFGNYYELQSAKIHDVFAELERNAHRYLTELNNQKTEFVESEF